MKKLTSALAVAALLAGPAIANAQKSEGASLYGRIHMSINHLDTTVAGDDDSGQDISANSTRFGIKGKQALDMMGLSAVYQIESSLMADEDEGGGRLAHRNSFIGVQGDFGLLRFGRFTSPIGSLRARTDFFADQIGDPRHVLTGMQSGRSGDSVYYSNKFGPIGLDVQYAMNGANYEQLIGNNDVVTVGLSYGAGPLWVGAAYQNAGENSGKDPVANNEYDSYGVGASYKFGNIRVAGMAQQFDPDAGEEILVYGGGVAFEMGNTTFKAAAHQRDHDAAERDALQWAVGVEQRLAKRTTAYLNYAATDNDAASGIKPWGSPGHGSKLDLDDGADGSAISLGLIHNF